MLDDEPVVVVGSVVRAEPLVAGFCARVVAVGEGSTDEVVAVCDGLDNELVDAALDPCGSEVEPVSVTEAVLQDAVKSTIAKSMAFEVTRKVAITSESRDQDLLQS